MSTLKFDSWNSADGVREFAPCTAWANFDGTGTVAIRDQLNVASVTDNGGAGNYTINFTTAMDNANYVFSGTAGDLGSIRAIGPAGTGYTTSSISVFAGPTNAASIDQAWISVVIHGGIA